MKNVIGIGMDAVDIARFKNWHTYADKKLMRLLSTDEIAYCRACPAKSAERFAARFAAREALYKALCQAYPHKKLPFLSLCRHVTLAHATNGHPRIAINWQELGVTPVPTTLLSLSHTRTTAYAWILLSTT